MKFNKNTFGTLSAIISVSLSLSALVETTDAQRFQQQQKQLLRGATAGNKRGGARRLWVMSAKESAEDDSTPSTAPGQWDNDGNGFFDQNTPAPEEIECPCFNEDDLKESPNASCAVKFPGWEHGLLLENDSYFAVIGSVCQRGILSEVVGLEQGLTEVMTSAEKDHCTSLITEKCSEPQETCPCFSDDDLDTHPLDACGLWSYGPRTQSLTLLNGISFSVRVGDKTCKIGTSIGDLTGNYNHFTSFLRLEGLTYAQSMHCEDLIKKKCREMTPKSTPEPTPAPTARPTLVATLP